MLTCLEGILCSFTLRVRETCRNQSQVMRIHCRFSGRIAFTFILYILLLFILMLPLILIKSYTYTPKVSFRKSILESLRIRNTSALVQPNVDTTIIQTPNLCKPNHNTTLLAVIVIISKPEDTMKRNQIRKHWNGWLMAGNSLLSLIRRVFFVGMPKDNDFSTLQEESAKYNDLVVDALFESYYALTLKTLRILKWFLKHCKYPRFLVKSDVDVLIHLPNLIKFLQSFESHGQVVAQKLIGGDLSINSHPYTDEGHKWYIPPEILKSIDIKPGSPYPDYVLGGFYVLSFPLIRTLFKESFRVPLIHFEDVFLTGLVANRNLGYKLTEIPNIFNVGHSYCFENATHYVYNPKLIACNFHGKTELLNLYYENYQSQYKVSHFDAMNN